MQLDAWFEGLIFLLLPVLKVACYFSEVLVCRKNNISKEIKRAKGNHEMRILPHLNTCPDLGAVLGCVFIKALPLLLLPASAEYSTCICQPALSGLKIAVSRRREKATWS